VKEDSCTDDTANKSAIYPSVKRKMLLLTFSVVTVVIGVRAAINRRASELRRMNPA
jgi:hypothetical protein